MANTYSKKTERNFILALSVIFIGLTFLLVKDIFAILVYSGIFAFFLMPAYNYFNNKFKNEKIAALTTLTLGTVVVILPILFLLYYLILESIKLISDYTVYLQNPELLNIVISNFMLTVTNSELLASFDYSGLITTVVRFILDLIESFITSIPLLAIYFFIVLFITYYLLIYNKSIFKNLNDFIPLSLRKQNEITKNISKNITVLFRGYFLTGLIQTGVALIGYIIFGLPNLLILTALTLIVSLIPYLGTPLIWVPAGIYLILTGNQVAGIGLLIYGTLIISTIDNFIRPHLMSDKDTISPPLVFIGLIGGVFAFGIHGIILGPIIISITAILLKYLQETYSLPQK